MTIPDRKRTWRFPRMLLKGHIIFGSLMWSAVLALSLVVAAVVSRFADLPGSIWEQSSQATAWYVAGISGYIVYQTVPLLIAHGRTRRDTATETVIFMGVFAAVAALLVAAGYLIEYAVYGFAGWTRDLSGDRLFSSHLDVAMIFAQYWLTFIVWGTAGALFGAAFYRYDEVGWLASIPAAILIGLADIFTSTPWEPIGDIIERILSVESPSLALATLMSFACFVIGIALTWPILRDMPLRNR